MLNIYRWVSAVIVLLAVPTTPLAGQERNPAAALTGGLGNVLGGLGAGVEYYFAGSRLSAAAGLGYWRDPCATGEPFPVRARCEVS